MPDLFSSIDLQFINGCLRFAAAFQRTWPPYQPWEAPLHLYLASCAMQQMAFEAVS